MPYARCVRPSTKSQLIVEVPEHVAGNDRDIVQWIGEEFDWQWIPISYNPSTTLWPEEPSEDNET